MIRVLCCWLVVSCGAWAADADAAVRARIAGFAGKVAIAAKNLDTGASYELNADEAVRTASTIKLPIMVEAFGAVAERRAKWTEKLKLRPETKVSGSGVLREFSDGVKIPLRDLVHLMIVVSDNTATNLILDRLSADAVNRRMDSLGLARTHSLRKVRGDGTNLKAPTGWSAAGRIEENQKYGIGMSTPREMVKLLEMLHRGQVVSAEASREMIEILKRQQYNDGIGRRMRGVQMAHKTGALDALRSDVGIVYAPKGPVAMAITVDGMAETDYSPDNAGLLLLSDLSQILFDALGK